MSVQQGGIESWQCSHSPVERGLFMLDVPGLQKAADLGMRVGVDHCGLGQVDLVPSSEYVLCQCRGRHIPIPEGPPMFCDAMVQRSASLPDVSPWTLIAWNAIHYTLPLAFWDGVFRVDQLLSQSPEGAKGDLYGQGAQHPTDRLR